MPKFTIHGSVWVSIDVEADSQEEAEEMYQKSTNDYDSVIADMHTVAYRGIDSVEEN